MDLAILHALNGLATVPAIAAIGIALSSRWMLVVVGLPLAVSVLRKRDLATAVTVVLATAAAEMASSHLVKPFFARVRPCRALHDVFAPDGCGPGAAFPSSHAATAFGLVLSAAPFVPHGHAILLPIAIAVSASRVLIGVHYPSDVAAGALLGASIGLLAAFGRKKLLERQTGKAPSPPEAAQPDGPRSGPGAG